MQLLTSVKKYLLLIVISSCLILAWDGGNTEFFYYSAPARSIADENTTRNHAIDSIWATMSSEMKLDHRVQSAQVRKEINKLLADQEKLYSILKAGSPYIYYIYNQTKMRGLPAELALIPVIESEFNPNDHSNKGATGLWQLMSATAHELGVKVVSGYDGRRNVIDSTVAALAYFNDLGKNFKGDWYLAIAAYNCGQGRIQSALNRTGLQSFWGLPLPQETKVYVPKLLAVAAIVKNPKKYGVTLPHVENQPYFVPVKATKEVNLKQVAQKAGINIKTLQTLNPDYKNQPAPKKKGGYTLLVPVNRAPAVKAQLGVS